MVKRLYVCVMKAKEKRIVKGYKIAMTHYNRAMKRAKKDQYPLATLIEEWVTDYGKYGTIIKQLQLSTKK